MKAIQIQNKFGMENLALVERPDPTPGPYEVLIEVKAASLNFRDLMTVLGTYNPRQSMPLIPCSDGAGVVAAVGTEVTRVQVGDRVAGIFAQKWLSGPADKAVGRSTLGGPLDGMLAEQVVLNEEGVVKLPDHLSFEEGATLPCAGVTAWHALIEHGWIKAGDQVLLQGTGGVSLQALLLARACGAEVFITSSSDEKLARAQALGAAHVINYKHEPEWEKKVVELSGGGVDHVVEVGGAGTLAKSIDAVRLGGKISVIGVLSGIKTDIDLRRILMRGVQLQGVFVGSRQMFEDMNRAIALHRLQPVIDRVFPLEQTREAFQHMASGKHFGKIVIRLG
jgi:NADPH:quinone reductase-like Zn-dependent oxidoreductase